MTYSTVLAKKEYTDDSGELHKRWYPVGYVKENPLGGTYLTLNMFPETTYILVPSESKEDVIQLDD